MAPRQAKKLATILLALNWLLVIALIPIAIKSVMDYFLPNPPQRITVPENQNQPNLRRKSAVALDDFRVCWEADIVETAPKLTPRANDKPKPPAIRPELLPFEWVWAIPNPNPDKSFAVLADRGSKKQILAQQGSVVGGTNYRVVAITDNQITFALGDLEVILPRPQPSRDVTDISANTGLSQEQTR